MSAAGSHRRGLRIDICRLARLDPTVPIEDTVGAIAELVEEGHVRHIGLSEVDADTFAGPRRGPGRRLLGEALRTLYLQENDDQRPRDPQHVHPAPRDRRGHVSRQDPHRRRIRAERR
ncbi:aldo/keto reductase [Actinoplanes sp. ATCC 53533]|uniref:aldo/keto reductase n=1 Tax=Actinoplanes sp. ATCC 53533 TaxID=1288362 RepID=UPI0018F64329